MLKMVYAGHQKPQILDLVYEKKDRSLEIYKENMLDTEEVFVYTVAESLHTHTLRTVQYLALNDKFKDRSTR